MKLAISNIAWTSEQDEAVYSLMREYGFAGLEIAPTRIFPEAPYERVEAAAAWARDLRENYGFVIPSIQSIWFGRKERVFGTEEERQILITYTKKAIDFAAATGCKNLVFGCPGGRNVPEGTDAETVSGIADAFFRELGAYAAARNTAVGMEANPPIYHTNYINDTPAALALIGEVASPGFRLNLDVGTMLCNGEPAEELAGRVGLISHVHISEPGLKPIERRELHRQLRELLEAEGYEGFVSVEMGKQEDLRVIEGVLQYTREIFG